MKRCGLLIKEGKKPRTEDEGLQQSLERCEGSSTATERLDVNDSKGKWYVLKGMRQETSERMDICLRKYYLFL